MFIRIRIRTRANSTSSARLSRDAIEAPWCSFTFSGFFSCEFTVCIAKASDPTSTHASNIAYQIFNIKHIYPERNMYLLHYTLCIM